MTLHHPRSISAAGYAVFIGDPIGGLTHKSCLSLRYKKQNAWLSGVPATAAAERMWRLNRLASSQRMFCV